MDLAEGQRDGHPLLHHHRLLPPLPLGKVRPQLLRDIPHIHGPGRKKVVQKRTFKRIILSKVCKAIFYSQKFEIVSHNGRKEIINSVGCRAFLPCTTKYLHRLEGRIDYSTWPNSSCSNSGLSHQQFKNAHNLLARKPWSQVAWVVFLITQPFARVFGEQSMCIFELRGLSPLFSQ